jgi:hypothetical protein
MQPALTPETPAAAVTTPATITAPVEAPATDAARERVKPPEDAQVQPATDASLAPIEPKKLPEVKPAEQVHTLAPSAMAANDPLKDTAIAIEKQLAQYIGERLTAEQAQGLTVDVVLAKSNAVTGFSENSNHYDLAINLKGGIQSVARAQAIQNMLDDHPALTGIEVMPVVAEPRSNNDSAGTYSTHSRKFNLDSAHIANLLKPHPIQQGTPITGAAVTPEAHACTGANCSHHASPAKAEAAPAVVEAATTVAPAAPVAEAAATPLQSPAPVAATLAATEAAAPPSAHAAAPATEQPAVGEAKPADLATAPVTQVAAPAEHQGVAANKDKLAIGA